VTAPHAIFLKLEGRPVLVVGGGPVAERKIAALLVSGAVITVVSPEATASIRELARAGRLRWVARPYERGDIGDAPLVYVAAGRAEVNGAVRQDALGVGAWVNVADEPDLCDFFVPAVVQRGDLSIAVSTSGASPALARRIRETLDAQFGPEYEAALQELRAIRDEARASGRPLAELGPRFAAIIDRLLPRA
jgi:precorrin-2 dehydrogenase / sirohydrochlorin ferrochelatase